MDEQKKSFAFQPGQLVKILPEKEGLVGFVTIVGVRKDSLTYYVDHVDADNVIRGGWFDDYQLAEMH